MSGRLASNEVDVVVVEGGAGEHGSVRMECGASYRRRTVLVQEARVRLERGEVRAVDVEGLDLVAVCASLVELVFGFC